MDKEDVVRIYTMECYLTIKKNEIRPFSATWMDPESVILSELSQRKRNIIWHPLYLESKKKWYKWTYLQSRHRLTDLENEFLVAGGEGIVKDFGKVVYTLLYLKKITSKNQLYSTWNSVQCYVPAWRGEGEWIYVYTWLSPFAVHLKVSQHFNQLYPNKNVFGVKKLNKIM